jgi:membrane protein
LAKERHERDADRRGEGAIRPWQIPPRGWVEILIRVFRALREDNLNIVAAGVAFYAMLAIFPGLAALVAVYGLFADPADVHAHLAVFSELFAPEAWALLDQQLSELAAADSTGLTLTAGASLLVALWSASRGVRSLITALNMVYGERERRGFLRSNALALGLAIGGILTVVFWIGLIVVLPALLRWIGLADFARDLIVFLRWPLLVLLFLMVLSVVYRFGPDRRAPRLGWVSVGAVVAVIVWLIASLGFAYYVSGVGIENETYGAIGAIFVLLLWFFISAYIVLFGAELNAEIEHQTTRDTTVGREREMGERGAHVADTEARRPDLPRWRLLARLRRWLGG